VSIADNKALARQFFEYLDRREYDAIAGLLTPEEISHLPGAPPLDWPAHQQYAAVFVNAFPDLHFIVEDQVADADNVVTRFTSHGTHKGDLMGVPPTGRQVAISGINWFQIKQGRIAEEWTHFDRIGMMVQLGVASTPPAGGPLVEANPDRPEQLASLSDPRGVVGRWFARVDRGGMPDVGQYVVDGYVDHNPPPVQGLGPGITGVRQVFQLALRAFGEFHHTIDASIAEGEKVASRVTGYGKHTGEFLGIPPTGKQVSMSGITIHRVTNGKLAEHWAQIDALSLLQQLGAVPA